jgi:opacity protein-like surface antigen
MKRFSVLPALVLVLATVVVSQEVPKAEVYLGYSYTRVNPVPGVDSINSNGGIGAFQYNLNKNFGIVAELGGSSNGNITGFGLDFPGDQTQFSYLFGPRFTVNKTGRFSPFVHYLLGGVHNHRSFTIANSLIPVNAIVPSGVTVDPISDQPGFSKIRSSQNAFAMALGGGVDFKVGKHLAVRPAQVDWLPTHFSPFNVTVPSGIFPNFNTNNWQQNFRYSGGVTFLFGGGSSQ